MLSEGEGECQQFWLGVGCAQGAPGAAQKRFDNRIADQPQMQHCQQQPVARKCVEYVERRDRTWIGHAIFQRKLGFRTADQALAARGWCAQCTLEQGRKAWMKLLGACRVENLGETVQRIEPLGVGAEHGDIALKGGVEVAGGMGCGGTGENWVG